MVNLLFSRVRHIVGGGNLDQIPPAPRRASPSNQCSNLSLAKPFHSRYPGRTGDLLVARARGKRSEEQTPELKSLMRSSYAVFYLKKKTNISTEQQQVIN